MNLSALIAKPNIFKTDKNPKIPGIDAVAKNASS